MKFAVAVFLLIALVSCVPRPTLSDLSIREIEQLLFDDAYRFWQQEKNALASKSSGDESYSILAGSTDSQNGEFTPSRIAVLECRLGREAHLHDRFLWEQLATDADVHRILEASSRMCAECGVASKAQVVLSAEGNYSHRDTDGWSPQVQQKLWLEALNGTNSQQDGAANGSQPVRSETNRTSSPTGSRP